MKIIYRKTNELKEYSNNPKKHPKKQIDKIKKSINEFGFRVPILIDKNDTIISGHGRIIAAKELEIKEVPTILVENLSPEQIKAFRIADNKVSLSEWDMDYLKDEFKDLKEIKFDLDLTGFDVHEVDNILNINAKDPGTEVDQLGKLMIKCPKCGERFSRKGNVTK